MAAVWAVPGPSAQVPTLVLTFAFVAVGVALSKRFGSDWALAAYGAAIGASLFAVARMEPFGAGQVEALLLVFAAVAYVVTFLEREPWAATAPMLYAFGAVAVQPDAHALLPLALGCAVGGLVVGRALGIRWSYPFYAAAVVAGVATAVLGRGDSSFDAWTLLVLAFSSYVIAAVESQPEVLPVALLLGVLALAAGSGALGLAAWQVALSYAGLAWLYALGRYVWTALPGLRPRGTPWWTARIADAERKVAWSDPRVVGAQVHRWASVLVGGGAVVGGLLAPDAFALHASQTLVVGVTLLSLAGILALLGRDTTFRLAFYGAGGLTALTVTWLARWLGADNVQAFVLAPGSYLLLIGALLPVDAQVKQGEPLGQGASLVGSLLLLIPTLGQSFQSDQDWIYALVLAAEALVIAGVGLGARSRALIVVGSAFVVLAAVRGAIIAVVSGVPIAVVIGLAGALVLGAATWLSLRARRDATAEA